MKILSDIKLVRGTKEVGNFRKYDVHRSMVRLKVLVWVQRILTLKPLENVLMSHRFLN